MVIRCLRLLFDKLAKNNKRLQAHACKNLLKVARLSNAQGLQLVLLVLYEDTVMPLAQMRILRLLVPEFGFHPGNGMHIHQVFQAVVHALAEVDEAPRKAGFEVAVVTQRLVGSSKALAYLSSVKPLLLKELKKEFGEASSETRPTTVCPATDFSKHKKKNKDNQEQCQKEEHSQSPGHELPNPVYPTNDRQLSSAPVGSSEMGFCDPPPANTSFSLLDQDEEELMNTILG